MGAEFVEYQTAKLPLKMLEQHLGGTYFARKVSESDRAMLQLLLVENDADVGEVLKDGIEASCEAAVTWAKTGSTACHVLGTQEFDAAVIETLVPEISGFELARRAANSNVPVLLMSGHPEQQDLCREYWFPFVAKPFLPSALSVSIMAILHRTPQNIARVQQSCSRLATTMMRSKLLALEASRLCNESRVLRAETMATRNRLHDALDAIRPRPLLES